MLPLTRGEKPHSNFLQKLPSELPVKMNKTFTEVASAYRVVEKLSHQQRVTRLYRKSLRTVDNWAMDREIFHRESAKIRAQFEANKKLDATSG